jgi:formylglycine-generating enzyme required for sulfatase activity
MRAYIAAGLLLSISIFGAADAMADLFVHYSASAGFWHEDISPVLPNVGDEALVQLMFSIDGIADDIYAGGVPSGDDQVLDSWILRNENGSYLEQYAIFTRDYSGPFIAGYMYGVIYERADPIAGDRYYAGPLQATEDIVGFPPPPPDSYDLNTDLVNGNTWNRSVEPLVSPVEVPHLINYQARLLDNQGNPVSSNIAMSVSIFTNQFSGPSVYMEDLGTVPCNNGIYSFNFGSSPIVGDLESALGNPEAWLEVTVNGLPLLPRQRLVAVPYSLVAGTAKAVEEGAITSSMMADHSVQSVHIADNSITSKDVQDLTIDGRDLAPEAVQSAHIADNTITSADIENGTITGSDIALNLITAEHIVDNTITGTDIQDATIIGTDIAPDNITSGHIVDNSITSADIQDSSITSDDIQNFSITGFDIGPNAITSGHVVDDSLYSSDIRNDTILGVDIAAGAVGTSEIEDGSITAPKLAPGVASPWSTSGNDVYYSGGNIGIGTNNPSKELEVVSKSVGGGVEIFGDASVGSHDSPSYGLSGIDRDGTNRAGYVGLALANAHYSIHAAKGDVVLGAQDASIHFSTQSSGYPAKMTIQSGGKVGIGTTSPTEQLEVAGRIVVGDSTNATPLAGTIRWTGADFEGYTGSEWLSLTSASGPGSTGGTVVANMVLIPGGSFDMGDAFGEGNGDESPVHGLIISGFYMDETEVTKAKWDEVILWAIGNGYSFVNVGSGKGTNHPVHTVDWYDCVKWANARSEMDGLTPCYYTEGTQSTVYRTGQVNVSNDRVNWTADGYRLPTEAEWEKAARGGFAGRRFPWSDADTISHSRANYRASGGESYDLSDPAGYHPGYDIDPTPYTSPVGSFAGNGYGLYDMAGNVWEWCWDWYDFSYYGASPVANPRGPVSGSNRVLRVGSWGDYANGCRVADRGIDSPGDEGNFLGFRLVRAQ